MFHSFYYSICFFHNTFKEFCVCLHSPNFWRWASSPVEKLQYSCQENSTHRGAWWAIVHGLTVRHNWATNNPPTYTHTHACTHTHTHTHVFTRAPDTESNPLILSSVSQFMCTNALCRMANFRLPQIHILGPHYLHEFYRQGVYPSADLQGIYH